MTNISEILCVIDPTSENQPALQRAAWLAGRIGATLELFICYYNEYLRGDRIFDSRSFERTRQEVLDGHARRLEKMAQPLRDKGITVRTSAEWDHPLYEGVARHAASVGADIVFKDTHHHSATSRGLFTNSDWNLIRTCPVPLWLVKPVELAGKPIFIAAIDPVHEHDKPAALDDAILSIAKSLAERTGAEVHAFHSFDPRLAFPAATANAYIPVLLNVEEVEKTVRTEHQRRFTEITRSHGIDAERSHFVSGLAQEELPVLATELNASVVVMGAIARNRLKRLFIGATAERTLEKLPCDLLIIKPHWFSAPVETNRVESTEQAASGRHRDWPHQTHR
jgi:universal stress protein E